MKLFIFPKKSNLKLLMKQSIFYCFKFFLLACFLSISTTTFSQIKVNNQNNVGIGNDNPQSKLHIDGEVRISTLDTDALGNPPATNGTTKMVISDTDGKLSFADFPTNGVQGSGVATQLAFWTGTSALGSSSNLFWDNLNSRLGIGTVSPTHQLTTSQDISVNGLLIGNRNGGVNTIVVGSPLGANTSGSNNVVVGYGNLSSNTTGSSNVCIGNFALNANMNGHSNVALGTFALLNSQGNLNVGIGHGAGATATASNRLYIENSTAVTPLIGGHFDNRRVGINTNIADLARTLDVNGQVRIRDLITDTPTRLIGADADGDLNQVTLGSGLNLTGSEMVAVGASYGQLYNTGNLLFQTLDFTKREVDFTSEYSNSMTVSTAENSITIPSSGTYEITYSGSYGLNSTGLQSIYLELFLDNNSYGYHGQLRSNGNTTTSSGQIFPFHRSIIAEFTSGDELKLYYQRFQGTATQISFWNLNFSVKRLK